MGLQNDEYRKTDEEALNHKDGKSEGYARSEGDESLTTKVKVVLNQAIPTIVCLLIVMIQEMVNLIFVGHLNDEKILAGVGLGIMLQNVFGLSIVLGINGAIETLVSQAYGNGNLHLCGIYLNRGRFVVLLTFIPLVALLCNTENILVLINQNAEIAKYSQVYVNYQIPGLVLSGLSDAQRKFLNMFEMSSVPLVCFVVGELIHVLLCAHFVWNMELSIIGVGYASSITNFIIYILLLIYTSYIKEIREAVQWPNKSTF